MLGNAGHCIDPGKAWVVVVKPPLKGTWTDIKNFTKIKFQQVVQPDLFYDVRMHFGTKFAHVKNDY